MIMFEQVSIALLITVVGMGLVFAALILLQVFMTLLVRFTSVKQSASESDTALEDENQKQEAAVIAVGIALAEQEAKTPREFPLPPTAIVSAWQLAQRANTLNRRGPTR